jgi:hypothetical protein
MLYRIFLMSHPSMCVPGGFKFKTISELDRTPLQVNLKLRVS